MIQNECDKKEKIVKQLYMSQGKVTELVEAGYTVTIRPVKEGLKVTYHKEKVVKQDELYSHRKLIKIAIVRMRMWNREVSLDFFQLGGTFLLWQVNT